MGFSRGAGGDLHVSSRTFKGSCCTFRAREARRRAERGSRDFPRQCLPGGHPPAATSLRVFIAVCPVHPPETTRGVFPGGGERVYPPPLTGASPLLFLSPARRSGEGAGGRGGGEPCRLLGLVVRGPAAASPPARPGTTVPTWPCALAHELLGALAHLLYCLAEDKKKSNWRDYKANVAGAAGAK